MEKKSVMQISASILKALMISGLTTLLLLLVLSYVTYRLDLGESIASLGIIITYILSCFLGGLYLGHKMDKRKFMWGLGTGLCYFLILILLSVLISEGVWMDPMHILTTLAICLGAGCIGGMLA